MRWGGGGCGIGGGRGRWLLICLSFGWCRQDGMVVIVLLLLIEDLELQEELLLLEDFGIR